MQADRALAYAAERNQMARAELVAKAELALDQGMYSAALQLYRQATQIDPSSVDARTGVSIAERLQHLMERVHEEQAKLPAQKRLHGDQVPQEVRKRFREEMNFGKGGEQIVRVAANGTVRVEVAEQAPAAAPAAPTLPAPAQPDILADVKARQAVAEQQQTVTAEQAIRTANRLVETDPNGARELLKRTIESVRNNPDVSDRYRASLGDRIERALASVDRRGVVVLRDQQQAQENAARVAARVSALDLERSAEDLIRERMRVIHNLFNQAREQEAYKQALAIRQDLIAQGRPVPPSVTAAYTIGLTGYHLREEIELKRIREERFLATMLQVEKSHIPFPDEPPVVFPPAAEWKALTDSRKVRYESSNLGSEVPKKTLELRDTLGRTIKYDGIEDPKITLQEALDQLADRYKVQFDVNEKAFKFEMLDDVLKKEIASPTPIPAMTASLGTILRKILSRLVVNSGATFLIRRDTIEITTGLFATAEKALRVYPAGDLVLPIPNSVNVNAVNQSATLFGFAGAVGVQVGVQLGAANAFGIAGAGLGALGVAGGLGAVGVQLGGVQLGALGVQLGALGVQLGGVQLGALGVQVGAVQIGAPGGIGGIGGNGVQLGGQFQGNFQGAANLGVGGGAAGLGGGQLGQFGNLGGQFGLQGGDQSRILITLIRQVVGRPADWGIAFDPVTGRPLNQLDDGDATITNGENNQVAYYPPALALVVKGTSRIQTRTFSPIQPTGADKGQVDARPVDRAGDRMVRIGADADGKRRAGKVDVAGNGDRAVATAKAKEPPLDPRTMWENALARGVSDPGLIIATADFLAQNRRFDHVAEFLKADLRQGIVVKPWVYQSLAIALRASGGSAEEIERAETASLELEPADAQSYLSASRAMAKDKRFDRAVAFCRQASLLEPNAPNAYAEALMYAEQAQDSKAMEWAAGNLVKQEWPQQNKELHDKASLNVASLEKILDGAKRGEDARHMVDAIRGQKRRDLVIKLNWQGEADLDLKVQEPSGSVCSSLNRQTVGGGTLVGDTLVDMTSETYAASQAFSGDYIVSVERFRGHSLGDRAQLRVIQHQGTPEETEQLISVDLRSAAPVKVHLNGGRRLDAAYVSPPSSQRPIEAAPIAKQDILSELRSLADPDVTGVTKGFQAHTSSPTATQVAPVVAKAPEPSPNDQAYFQTKISSFVKNSLDVTAQATLSADRRHVRVSLAPLSAPSAATSDRPVVVSDPLIPGGN
jgi:tetratricopeptide (TPR) repeat protein